MGKKKKSIHTSSITCRTNIQPFLIYKLLDLFSSVYGSPYKASAHLLSRPFFSLYHELFEATPHNSSTQQHTCVQTLCQITQKYSYLCNGCLQLLQPQPLLITDYAKLTVSISQKSPRSPAPSPRAVFLPFPNTKVGLLCGAVSSLTCRTGLLQSKLHLWSV